MGPLYYTGHLRFFDPSFSRSNVSGHVVFDPSFSRSKSVIVAGIFDPSFILSAMSGTSILRVGLLLYQSFKIF